MSRIGETNLTIPQGVEITFVDNILKVKGPKGELLRDIRKEVSFEIGDGVVKAQKNQNTKLADALYGTYMSHLKNMVAGVTEGHKKSLKVEGVGYKVDMQGSNLVLKVGFSHNVIINVPEGLNVSTTKDNEINIEGIDKELVGKFSAETRLVKKPEPYKGKGIRYIDEVIRRKQGKRTSK